MGKCPSSIVEGISTATNANDKAVFEAMLQTGSNDAAGQWVSEKGRNVVQDTKRARRRIAEGANYKEEQRREEVYFRL